MLEYASINYIVHAWILHASTIDNQYFTFASTFHPWKPLSLLQFFGDLAKASLYIDNSSLERLGQPSSTHSRRNLLRDPSRGAMASGPKRRLLVVLCIALLVELPWWSISAPRITIDLGIRLATPTLRLKARGGCTCVANHMQQVQGRAFAWQETPQSKVPWMWGSVFHSVLSFFGRALRDAWWSTKVRCGVLQVVSWRGVLPGESSTMTLGSVPMMAASTGRCFLIVGFLFRWVWLGFSGWKPKLWLAG
jgi:hypothetical protein